VGVERSRSGSGWVLAHCWALRDQPSVGGAFEPPRTVRSLCGGGVAVVGVDLVKWIVDASIWRRLLHQGDAASTAHAQLCVGRLFLCGFC